MERKEVLMYSHSLPLFRGRGKDLKFINSSNYFSEISSSYAVDVDERLSFSDTPLLALTIVQHFLCSVISHVSWFHLKMNVWMLQL